MTRFTSAILTVAVLCGCFPGSIFAQGFGGFGGSGGFGSGSDDERSGTWIRDKELPLLAPEQALNVITIDGTADLRVAPEGIRLVLAITSEAESAKECQALNAAQIKAVRAAWGELKIDKDKVVEDFINVLPRYEWRVTQRDGQQMRVQQLNGYRMQSNLHVSLKTEQEAMAAINLAFEHGVTDIVTFDYWHSQLDEHKKKARAAAVKAAREKAELLLAVFPEPPKVINIQESTAVFLPHYLYQTYENVLQEEVEYNNAWRDKPAIKAYRPKMTFFHGLQARSDVRATGPAMKPEIAVASTVRIYYQSPADKTLDD